MRTTENHQDKTDSKLYTSLTTYKGAIGISYNKTYILLIYWEEG